MTTDINQAAMDGSASVGDLLDAAEAKAPIVPEAQLVRFGKRGQAALDAAAEKLRAIEDHPTLEPAERKRQRGDVFVGLQKHLDEIAAGFRVMPAGIESTIRFTLRTFTGCSAHADALLGMIKRRAVRQESEAAEVEDRKRSRGSRSAELVRWMQALGVDSPGRWKVPSGYKIDRDGLWLLRTTSKGDAQDVRIASRPPLLVAHVVDIVTGLSQVELAWHGPRRQAWVRHVCQRRTAKDRQRLLQLADHEADVDSNNAGEVIAFISAWEDENRALIGRAQSSERMGWLGDQGSLGFLVGERWIGPKDGEPVALVTDGPEQVAAKGWAPRGDPGVWASAVVGAIAGRPMAAAGLCMALSSVLLLPLGTDGFAMSMDGGSGTGKSTSQRIGASVWGSPKNGEGVVASWNMTAVGPELLFEFCQSLPVILEDTRDIPHGKEHLAVDALYAAQNGCGRTRGTTATTSGRIGLRASGSWLTTLWSTGEQPITQIGVKVKAGASLRCLPLRGAPFGAKDGADPASRQENAAAAAAVKSTISAHYGHLGPAVVRWLVEQRERDGWEGLRHIFAAELIDLGERAGPRAESRMLAYVAVLKMAHWVAFEACGFFGPEACELVPWGPIEEVLLDAVRVASLEANTALTALQMAYAWAAQRPGRFYASGGPVRVGGETLRRKAGPRNSMDGTPKPRSWAGRWEVGDWQTLDFTVEALEREVWRDAGIRWAEVRDAWRSMGVIVEDAEGRPTQRVRIDGARVKCVRLSREVLERLCGA